ncbi:hypothetical protein G6F22_016159 [Rhizopus arrhizus]|nr:hypothetical protein G6F22_016159 [Rhizopus arrhizus]
MDGLFGEAHAPRGELAVVAHDVVGVEHAHRLAAGLVAHAVALRLGQGLQQPDADRGLFRQAQVHIPLLAHGHIDEHLHAELVLVERNGGVVVVHEKDETAQRMHVRTLFEVKRAAMLTRRGPLPAVGLAQQPQAHQRVARFLGVPVAVGRPGIERPGVPRAAPAHAHIAAVGALRIIRGRVRVVVLAVPVRHPFPGVAVHVVQAEGVGRVGGHRRGERVTVVAGRCERLPFRP